MYSEQVKSHFVDILFNKSLLLLLLLLLIIERVYWDVIDGNIIDHRGHSFET
jgi:hypothetical protein